MSLTKSDLARKLLVKRRRQVQLALRKTLAKYQLHDLFDRAYGYIAAYY